MNVTLSRNGTDFQLQRKDQMVGPKPTKFFEGVPVSADDSQLQDLPSEKLQGAYLKDQNSSLRRASLPDEQYTSPQVKSRALEHSFLKASVSGIDMLQNANISRDIERPSMKERAFDQESNYTVSKPKPKNVSNFLKLVMAKSYQSNFIQNLMNKSYIKKPKHLTSYQIKISDDLSSDQIVLDDEGEHHFIQFLESKWRYVRNMALFQALSDVLEEIKIPVIDPASTFIALWDLFQICIVLLIMIWLPYKISFKITSIAQLLNASTRSFLVEEVLIALLGLDVVVTCNLAFIKKGVIMTQRSRIILNYLKQYAVIDVISIISVAFSLKIHELSFQENQRIYIQLFLCVCVYVLKYRKINYILSKIQEFFNLNGSLNDMMNLAQVLVIILLIGHIIACVWHGVAVYGGGVAKTWIQSYNLQGEDDLTLYNYSFYFATMTMTTVGYGDITPQNNVERLVCNITMFLACGVFAFSVNSIGIVLQNLYKAKMEYRRSVTLINNFMSKYRIHFSLQTRVRSYLEYIMKEEQEMNDEEISQIVQRLSSHLQEELQYQIRGNILQDSKVISGNFSQKLIKKLVNVMEEVRYSPEEQIITVLTLIDDSSLYLISKGEIEIVYEGMNQAGDRIKRNILKTLQKGDVFGEYGFFTGNQRQASAFSKGFSKVYKVQRMTFMHLLMEFPEDQEKFQFLRDSVLLYNDFTQLRMKCYSCERKDHLISECQVVHFKPDHERIIKKLLYPSFDTRYHFLRRSFKAQTMKIQKIVYLRARDLSQRMNQDQIRALNTEMEDVSFHSNIGAIQEVYDEEDIQRSKLDNEIPSLLKSPELRSNTRSLSRISQIPSQNHVDVDNDKQPLENPNVADLDNFFRKTNIKFTQRTAGFGGEMRESLAHPKVVQEIEEDSDDQDSPLIKPKLTLQVTKMNKTNSKLSSQLSNVSPEHQQTLKSPINKKQSKYSQMSGISKSTIRDEPSMHNNYHRQTSNRSQTYSAKISSTYQMNRSSTPKLERAEATTQSHHGAKSEQDFSHQRQTTRRKSSRTNTRVSYAGKHEPSVQEDAHQSNNTLHTSKNLMYDFDRMMLYDKYFPLNNYDYILKRYQKVQRFFGRKRLFKDTSLYAFNYLAIKKGARLRRLLEKAQSSSRGLHKILSKQNYSLLQLRSQRFTKSNMVVDVKATKRDAETPLFKLDNRQQFFEYADLRQSMNL